MDVTKRIINYIENNSLSAEVVADATGVNLSLLTEKGKRKLNAAEFLEICSYLNIDPKSLL